MIFYFIPSWYTEKHRWQTDEEPWYQPDSTGFDDSVSQIRMFRGQGEKIELLNLSYFPLLRRFLHRQGLYPLPYWSAFDKAQDIHTQSIGVLSYRDLSWPEHTEWIYSPFSIFAMVQGKRYARVNFTDGSELLSVDYYGTGGALIRTDLYDDRGFCSSYRTYQDGRETWQYFLNPYGKLQFRENLTTGAVDTEPDAGYPFRRLHYVHIREMLREILTASADDRTGNGAYIIASNSAHNRMVLETLRTERVALSYFRNRFPYQDVEYLKRDAEKASFLVTDTADAAAQIQAALGEHHLPVYSISPFDTRLVLGKSTQSRHLRIVFAAEDLPPKILQAALEQIYAYMRHNRDTILLPLVHRDGAKDAITQICQKVRNDGGYSELLLSNEPPAAPNGAEEEGTPGQEIPARIFPTQCRSEEELIDILQDTRLIVDVRSHPDLYLQIAGISAGIPQINYQSTQYIEHKKDGYLISDIHELGEALSYYLDGLAHWNEALVYCIQKIDRYKGKSLVHQWKEIFEGNDSQTPDSALWTADVSDSQSADQRGTHPDGTGKPSAPRESPGVPTGNPDL